MMRREKSVIHLFAIRHHQSFICCCEQKYDIIYATIYIEKVRYMALYYNRLWKLLIDRGMTRTQMRLAAGISTSTLAKLSKGEDVNTSILVKICNALGCGIRDIVDSVPREPRKTQKEFGK